jgi:S1-C subfamily serine protease
MKMRSGAVALVMLSGVIGGCGSTQTVVTAKEGTSTTTQTGSTQSLSGLVRRVEGGVVRIETDACDGHSVGTGFALSPRVVATVEHVVDGATSITIKRGGKEIARLGSLAQIRRRILRCS